MNFIESQTIKNLIRAFSAECQDGAKYQYMADEATAQQLSYVSTILKQLATNEMAHAKVLYDYISQNSGQEDLYVDIKATVPMAHAPLEKMLNIKGTNEQRQAEVVYPAFIKVAEKEGFTDIAKKMKEIAKVEAVHAKILDKLYSGIKNNTLYQSSDECCYKCFNCGYEQMTNKGWKKCPLCDKPQGYIKINMHGENSNCGCKKDDCNCKTAAKKTTTSSKAAFKVSSKTANKSKQTKKAK